jgi:hypothetical protein
MQDLRKLEDGFEIDGKRYNFKDIQSLKYLRSNIQHVGVVNANMGNNELSIFVKGSYKPIKIASLGKVYVAYLSEKSSREKSAILDDFYQHLYTNTALAIYEEYEVKLNSGRGLPYDCITLYPNGDVQYDGGSFNLLTNAPKCFLSYPNIEFKVGFGSSVGKSFVRALKGDLSINLQVDITTDTNIILAILKNHFGYDFN